MPKEGKIPTFTNCGGSLMCFSRSETGGLTLRDVKNEDRPGYVHENTGDGDKMSREKHGFYTKMHRLRDN
jgi:hypothetical protein